MDMLNLTGWDLSGLMLAQDGAAPLPGETTSLPINPDGTGGTTGGAAAPPSSGPFGPSFMFIMFPMIIFGGKGQAKMLFSNAIPVTPANMQTTWLLN